MDKGLINWVCYDQDDTKTHPKTGKKLLIYGLYLGFEDSVFLGHGRFVRSKDHFGYRTTYVAHEPNGYPLLKNPRIDIRRFSKVFWAYLFPPEFEPKSYHFNETEISRIVETASKQKTPRVRLKNKQRQFNLDLATDCQFSETLGAISVLPSGSIFVRCARMEIELDPDDLELSYFDPSGWNRFPEVTPPHGHWVECVFIENDQCIDREFLHWNDIQKVFVRDARDLWNENAVYASIADLERTRSTLFFRSANEE